MGTTCTKKSQTDEKGMEISQYCLGLPTIVRPILEQLPTKDLIELSLVSKLWNFEARSVMRERGDLKAYFSGGGDFHKEACPCQELEAFASDLEKMRVVPFSGLHLPIYNRVVCKSFPNKSLSSFCKVILDRVHWKHFAVDFGSNYWTNHNLNFCPALTLVKQILEHYCGVLEELTLDYANERLLGPIFQDRTMPRLKSLTIKSWPRDGTLPSTFIKKLVICAPNLQELYVNSFVDLRVNILEGSSAVLVPKYEFRPLSTPISEGLVGSIRPEEMTIMIHTSGPVDPELLNRFIPRVLQASHVTLKTLTMDHLFAVPLMSYGICLENVTTLEIYMNSHMFKYIEPSILKITMGLDFTRIFPKLNQVKVMDYFAVDYSSDIISAFVEQGTAVWRRALPDRATSIKHLNLEHCGTINKDILPLLAQMFPDVKTVQTKSKYQGGLFQDLRKHFLCLEKVIES